MHLSPSCRCVDSEISHFSGNGADVIGFTENGGKTDAAADGPLMHIQTYSNLVFRCLALTRDSRGRQSADGRCSPGARLLSDNYQRK